jgi:hypothetical protein
MHQAASLLWLVLPLSATAGDLYVTHQGRLLDTLGRPLWGTHDLRLSLYDAESGGADVWRRAFDDVSIQDGYYTVALTGPDASGRDLDGALGVAAPRFVAVAVGAPYTDLGPRTRIGTTALGAAPAGSDEALVSLATADGNTWYTSNFLTLSGSGPIPVVLMTTSEADLVVNGSRLGGPNYTGSAGDTVAVTLKAAPSLGESVGALLSVGGKTHAWTVRTTFACTPGTQIYDFSGEVETFIMPRACATLRVIAWGAGGGSGTPFSGRGGSGAFGDFTLEVPPDRVASVLVGGGGQSAQYTPYPNESGGGGGGGGGSFLALDETMYLAVAGGGGGGGGGSAYDGGAGGQSGHPGGGGGGAGAQGVLGGPGALFDGHNGEDRGTNGVVAAGGQGGGAVGALGGFGGGGLGGLAAIDGDDVGGGGGGGGGGLAGGGGGGAGGIYIPFDLHFPSSAGGGGSSGSVGLTVQTQTILDGAVQGVPSAASMAYPEYAPGVAEGAPNPSIPAGHGRVVLQWSD